MAVRVYMGSPEPSKPFRAAIACLVLVFAMAGCSSNTKGSGDVTGHRTTNAGLTFTIPVGWHPVPLVGLSGADVTVEIASSRVKGAVRTICTPGWVRHQLPAGGALLQVLEDHGAGAVAPGHLRDYPAMHKPFHLGSLQAQECGEAYDPTRFRVGERVFELRVWTAPTGASTTVRRQIEQFMDSLHGDSGTATASLGDNGSAPPQPPTAAPPVGPRTVSFQALRKAILQGAATDFANGTGVGPPHFEGCLQAKLRRTLDDAELASLVQVYRRRGGQQFTAQALSALAAPLGDRCGGRRFVPEMIAASEALRFGRPAGRALRRLAVTYGPYIGVRCRQANSTRCERIGIDIVLKKPVVHVSAWIAGRRISLTTPGLHDGVRGKDWVGFLANAGLAKKGSPLYIHPNGRNSGIWGGNPPVYVPIRVAVTYADGHRRSGTFPHVFLSPGWG